MKIKYSLLKKIVNKYKTPTYLIDLKEAEKSFLEIKNAFPKNTIITYATKANYSQSIIKLFNKLKLNFEVFTVGELSLLLDSGINPKKVIYTSISETKEEFKFAINNDVRFFIIGSFNGFCNLEKVVKKQKIKVDILLRIQPIKNVVAGVSTSGLKSKFGILFKEGNDSIEKILPKIKNNLNFKGFHFHIGSFVLDPVFYLRAIDKTLNFVKKNKIKIEYLDIGGGYPLPLIKKFGKNIGQVIEKWRKEIGNFKLIIEPGRSLVASSTTLITEVINIKNLYGKKIIIIDTSNDMVFTERCRVRASIKTISKSKRIEKYSIAGNLCNSKDWILEKPILLPKVNIEDLILFKNVGAYMITNNISYGLRKKPEIIAIKNNKLIKEKHPFELIAEA